MRAQRADQRMHHLRKGGKVRLAFECRGKKADVPTSPSISYVAREGSGEESSDVGGGVEETDGGVARVASRSVPRRERLQVTDDTIVEAVQCLSC